MKHITVLYTLVCDDVRREDNGKEIIIGVYSSDIRVSRFPANMRLVFWMQAIIGSVKYNTFQFRVIGPNEVELAAADVELEMQSQAGVIGTIPLRVPIQIQSAGDLRLEARDGPNDQWEELKRIPVVQGEPSARR